MRRSIFVLVILFAVATVMAPVLAWADSEYDAALQYYYKGRYEEAVKHLKEYVDKKPDPSAYYLIGYSLYELGRFKEASQYFEEAYLIDPNFSPEKSGLTEKFAKGRPEGIKRPSAVHKGRSAARKKKKVAEGDTKQQAKQEVKKGGKPEAKKPPPAATQTAKDTHPKKVEQTPAPGKQAPAAQTQ